MLSDSAFGNSFANAHQHTQSTAGAVALNQQYEIKTPTPPPDNVAGPAFTALIRIAYSVASEPKITVHWLESTPPLPCTLQRGAGSRAQCARDATAEVCKRTA